MDRQDVLKRLLYPKCKTAIEFKFDNLIVNPMLSYITVQDIAQLNKIATSLKYSSKPKEKYAMIDNIMTNRGFRKMASGTNRVTYRCLNDYRVVIKIAIDKVGLSDNGNEYKNQHLLKPFVTKCFEVSPCGTVGLFERVVPITSREEFVNISDDIFDLINNLIGKYVLEDIGEKFYMNYGLREGFGPVLLDYPYVFELDGRKLICNVPEPMEPKGYCGGEIDYDLGYNNLICRKCGKRYLATELKSESKTDKPKIIIEGEDTIMRCVLKRGDEVISELNSKEPVATKTIKSKKDFVSLKAQVSTMKEEPKEEPYKVTIKTSDDVQLTARLRGTPTSRDDEKARLKEERLAKNSETIPVSFDSVFKEEEPKPVSNFSVELNTEKEEVHEVEPIVEPVVIATAQDIVFNEQEDDDGSIRIIIDDDGFIYDYETGDQIGITIEKHRDEIDNLFQSMEDKFIEETAAEEAVEEEPVEEIVEETEIYTEEPEVVETVIESSEYKGNENYRTADFASPIENHYSEYKVEENDEIEEEIFEEIVETNEVKDEEVAEESVIEDETVDEEPVEESYEEASIPELIIHPREEDEEAVEESYEEEEYDPEYSNDEDESTESESTLDLY